jgi:hypothetical protein
MRGCLSVTARILAAILAIIFIIVTVLALFLTNLQAYAFNPQSYQRALREQDIYHRLPGLVARQLASGANYNPCAENPDLCAGEGEGLPEEQDGAPKYLENIGAEEWQAILSNLVTPEWMQAQAESVIDQLFAYLNGEQASLSLKLSLADLKVRITEGGGRRAILQLIQAQPDCNQEQLLAISQKVSEGSLDDFPVCNPPEEVIEQLLPLAEQIVLEAVQSMPEEVDLAQRNPERANAGARDGSPEEAMRTLRAMRVALRLAPLLAIFLLLLVTVFGVRSTKGWLRWWGIPLLISGLTGLALIFVMVVFAEAGIDRLLASQQFRATGFTPELVGVLRDILLALVRPYARRVLIQSGLLGLVGGLMLGISFLVKPVMPNPVGVE